MVKIINEMLCSTICASRPHIKHSTVKMYESNLRNLQSMFDADTYDFLESIEAVKEKIKHLHYTSQRNHYNAIIVLLMAISSSPDLIKEYGALRDALNEKYVEEQQSGTISDKQAGNFASIEEIKSMIEQMRKEIAFRKLKKKDKLDSKEQELLQAYVIFSILLRIPLRNDLSGMRTTTRRELNKIPAEEREHTNYLVVEKNSMRFVLNEYKTSQKYKEKTIEIPKDLERILRMYLKIGCKDSILFTSRTGKVLSRNALSRLLTTTSTQHLGKAVGSTMMRKIVASDLLKDVKKMEQELSHKMGTDISTIKAVYVKEHASPKSDDEAPLLDGE
jgi:hypothetical protein